MTSFRQNWRYLLVSFFLCSVFCGLGVRLAFLHLGGNEKYRDRVKRASHHEQKLVVGRGRVLDRNGEPLAMDLAVKNVCVDPKVINEKGHVRLVGRCLANALNVDEAAVFDRLNRPKRRFEYIKKFVKPDVADRLDEMQLTGVFYEETTKRYYPQGSLMCHVVGFSNMEGVGSAGVEMRRNSELVGRSGLRVGERDGKHREIYSRRSLEVPPVEGADVYLTLDMTVQYMLEKSLAKAMQENHAKGAWGIIQRIRTGEILAMASFPQYDLNAYSTSRPEERRNRAISYTYEPGSTFKVAVIAAALNEKLITPSDVIDCENGYWIYGRRSLRDFHPYGDLSVEDVLKKSSNIGAAKIAVELGPDRLEKYLRDMGIGRKSGVDLPGEEGGILHPRNKWSAISITRIAMGHEVAVTALQMLNVFSAIANDGFLMRPILLNKIVDSSGRLVYEAEPEVVSRPISSSTALTMRDMLTRVTEKGGTGRRAAIQGYKVAGKTGTAQKPIRGGYSDSANIASFAGFFPADNPEVSMIVVVDEPQPKHTGGAVSAPVFAEVGEELVRYLSTRPDDWSHLGNMVGTRFVVSRGEQAFAAVGEN